MASIKAPLQDILTALRNINVTNGDGNIVKLYTRVWNNQLNAERDGKSYDFQKPAAFVEFVSPIAYEQLGGNFATADIGVNIHIIHEFYNDGGYSFEDDLLVFTIRDAIVVELAQFKPTGCGQMVFVSDLQDFDHDNLYHYIVGFAVNFIDSTPSPYDPPRAKYKQKAAPTTLNTVVEIATEPIYTPLISKPFRIPNQ